MATPVRHHAEQPDRKRRPASDPAAPPTLTVRSDPAELLRLQRTAGNAAVSSLLAAPGNAAMTIQRYKSYEHVKAGSVASFMGEETTPYVVKKDETPASIAKAHGTTAGVLLERNKAKVKVWAAAGGREIEGFEVGETIVIPTDKPAMVPPAKGAKVSEDQINVTIHGVTMHYGEAMSMADYYGSFDEFKKAEPAEIQALLDLVRKESKTNPIKEEEWEKASGGRYMLLNRKNIGHFAPPDAALVSGPATATGVNHKTEWEKYHRRALELAQKGDRQEALAVNAFGDHYLTDAFASGHLFNKEDLMAKVTDSLKDKAVAKAFALAVATAVWKDSAAAAFISKYETVETHYWTHPSINSADRFAAVLEGINDDPGNKDVLPNAIAAVVHDQLNTVGVPVTNGHGDPPWTVKGDGSLEDATLRVMREAVAQSQINVINSLGAKTLDLPGLFKAVWQFTPVPTKEGKAQIHDVITSMTQPSNQTTIDAVADITKENLKLIIQKTVDMKKLRLSQ
jgi:hypothetical protein